jgi:hypothetical protein
MAKISLRPQTVLVSAIRKSWDCLGVWVVGSIVSGGSAALATAQPLDLPVPETAFLSSSVDAACR